MSATVRPYQRADKPACMAVFNSNIPEYFDASEEADLSEFLDAPSGHYYVVEQDGGVIGCGGYARESEGQARFTWGMVARVHHGEGLGLMLARHRLAAIEAEGGYPLAELYTTPKVAPFFKKLGFHQEHVEPDGFAPGMDKVQMIRPMKSAE